MNRRVVALLDTMWDWNARTSGAGYLDTAPSYYRIDPENVSGSRLYKFLGHEGEHFDDLLVTNSCPELVDHPTKKGKPNPEWVRNNLEELQPFCLLLVCGRTAQRTYMPAWANRARIVEMPHPAARMWTPRTIAAASMFIQLGKSDLCLEYSGTRLTASVLIPF